MRKFNCTGPCYPDEHYYVRRDKVMEKVKGMIDEGAYFVVYAPRQMGKTTLLENMLFELERENADFIGILVDFEIYKSQTSELFYENFSEKRGRAKKAINQDCCKLQTICVKSRFMRDTM